LILYLVGRQRANIEVLAENSVTLARFPVTCRTSFLIDFSAVVGERIDREERSDQQGDERCAAKSDNKMTPGKWGGK